MGTALEKNTSDHKLRLRERFLKNGLSGFHDYEVLELLLSYSIIRKDTKQLAKDLISKFGSVAAVMEAPQELLLEIDGMGERSVTFLKLIKEAGIFHLKEKLIGNTVFKDSQQVYEYLQFYFKGKKYEEFKVVYLNNQNIIVFEETLFQGTVNESRIYVRNLIERMILLKASAIVVAHNHPSGILTPSGNDIALTQKISKAVTLIEARLLDHLIVSDNGYYSFADERML